MEDNCKTTTKVTVVRVTQKCQTPTRTITRQTQILVIVAAVVEILIVPVMGMWNGVLVILIVNS